MANSGLVSSNSSDRPPLRGTAASPCCCFAASSYPGHFVTPTNHARRATDAAYPAAQRQYHQSGHRERSQRIVFWCWRILFANDFIQSRPERRGHTGDGLEKFGLAQRTGVCLVLAKRRSTMVRLLRENFLQQAGARRLFWPSQIPRHPVPGQLTVSPRQSAGDWPAGFEATNRLSCSTHFDWRPGAKPAG